MDYRRQNKYGNTKKEFAGRVYHSAAEARYAQILALRKYAGEITEIVPQFRLPLVVYAYPICYFVVDFKCTMADGTIELHEVKGFATAVFKLKWKLAQALYGTQYKFVLITKVI